MNYFAHALAHLDDPYFAAGTAVPDWLNVVDRRLRVRSKHARPFVEDADPVVATVARGIVQHHHDDGWFHGTPAFAELSLQFTAMVREVLYRDDGMRVYFLGHILVEILLDAHLIAAAPQRLHDYYGAMSSVDPTVVATSVSRMSGRPADRLAALIPRFLSERFLWDYADDEKLLFRLNQVMRRVRLPNIREGFVQVIPALRRRIADRHTELLPVETRG
jgi:hypothetical protein